MKNTIWRILSGIMALFIVATSAGCSLQDRCDEEHLDTSILDATKDDVGFITYDDVRYAIRESFFDDNALLGKTDFLSIYMILQKLGDERLLRYDNLAIRRFIEHFLISKEEELGMLSNEEYVALLQQCQQSDLGYLFEFNKDNKMYTLELYEEGAYDDYKDCHSEDVRQSVDNDKINLQKCQRIDTIPIIGTGVSSEFGVYQSYVIRDSENQRDSGISMKLDCSWHVTDGAVVRKKYNCKGYSAALTLVNGDEEIVGAMSHSEYKDFAETMVEAIDQGLTLEEFLNNNSERLTEVFGDDYSNFVGAIDNAKTNVKS